MIETYTHCAACKTDTRLGIEIHCVLCHTNYVKGTQHICSAIDNVVDSTKFEPSPIVEPSTIAPRYSRAQIVFAPSPVSVGARDWSEVHPASVSSGE